MKSVLISIQPKWCERIADGSKTIEVRKTKPKLETPFKVYIYCTKQKVNGEILLTYDKKVKGRNRGLRDTGDIPLAGKVIGEFICDEVKKGILDISEYVDSVNIGSNETCLRIDDIKAYLGLNHIDIKGQHNFYGWHISDLVIYDKPRELSEFYKEEYCYPCVKPIKRPIIRPPQSWCYVEEKE
jgi:predicted transcriptional regulator